MKPYLTPTVNITTSANDTCSGTDIHFTTTVTDSGAAPVYQWFKKNFAVGSNLPAYHDQTLQHGDIIKCVITTPYSCATPAQVTSNNISMAITPLLTPAVSIATPQSTVCPGSDVILTATVTNADATPKYQWTKNGLAVGNNTDKITIQATNANDEYHCTVHTTASCVTTPTIKSNQLSVNLHPGPQVHIDKTSTLCQDTHRILEAGNFASYLWNDGSTSKHLLVSDIGTYYVTVTDGNGCKGSDTSKIVALLPKPNGFMPPDTSICSYGSLDLKAAGGFGQLSLEQRPPWRRCHDHATWQLRAGSD